MEAHLQLSQPVRPVSGEKIRRPTRNPKFGKPSITDYHLRQLCNTRNRIGRHLPDRKDQWTEACRAVREYRKQLQDRQWQKFLDEVDVHHSPGKAWSVVNSLNGKFVPAPKNEVLIHNGRIYDTPAKKGTIFARKFAEVCRLKKSRQDSRVKRKLRKKLDAAGPMDESCRPYTMTEIR